MNTCEVCGQPHDGSCGDRFCSEHCKHVYSGRQSVAKRRANGTLGQAMQKARSCRTWSNPIDQVEGTCQFCGKVCKNQNSLRNHECRCKENPNRLDMRKGSRWSMKRLASFMKNRANHSRAQFVYTIHICSFCGKQWSTTVAGHYQHERHCEKNPNRVPGTWKGRHHTEEQRKRIAASQRKAHAEGRNSSWIGRRKLSYAEQSWFNILTNELGEKTFENNYYVGECHYWLDFAWPEKKIYFEVDGVTHYTEEGKKHDAIRTERLNELGWRLIGRCNWSEYQKMSFEGKRSFVQDIIQKIQQS